MLALYRSGRQAEALDAYRAARETLVEQLGIEPGPELRRLERAILGRIRAGRRARGPPRRPRRQRAVPSARRPRSSAATRELREVRALLARADVGS